MHGELAKLSYLLSLATMKRPYDALILELPPLGVSATAQADGGARPEMVTSAGSGALPREIFFTI